MTARSTLVAVLLGAAVILPAAGTASAHDDKGTIEVISAEPQGLSIRYEVSITYDNDGHGAADATATVVAEADGLTVGPDLLEATAIEGVYAATVTFPKSGSWTVRFSSLTPTATLELDETIDIAPTTTVVPSTTPPPRTTAVAPTVVGLSVEDDEGGTGTVVFLVVIAVVAIGGAALVWSAKRKQSR